MKRLSIFLDGTWNDAASKTNVIKLYQLVAPRGVDGIEQQAHYDAGVGTRRYDRFRGGVVGAGLSRNVREAYQWLLEHYADGDEVYIFGFSRGAYTARSLGGLIAGCGLAKQGSPLTIEGLYARYQRRKQGAEPIYGLEHIQNTGRRRLTDEERTLLAHSRRIQIKMIGVWDTVGALGVPWTGMPLIGRDQFYFHNPNLSKVYENAFQALAIDEHRGAYKPTLWTLFSPDRDGQLEPASLPMPSLERVEQRWFIGAHANVGGGYSDDPLGKIPLAWLQAKAEGLGLHFWTKVILSGEEHLAQPIDSYAQFLLGAYQVLTLNRRHYRAIGVRINKVKTGWSFPINETIDASVFRRIADVPAYRPVNLKLWSQRTERTLLGLTGDQLAVHAV